MMTQSSVAGVAAPCVATTSISTGSLWVPYTHGSANPVIHAPATGGFAEPPQLARVNDVMLGNKIANDRSRTKTQRSVSKLDTGHHYSDAHRLPHGARQPHRPGEQGYPKPAASALQGQSRSITQSPPMAELVP